MNYQINGLATEEDYRTYNGDCPYQQLVVEEVYELSSELPDIRSIDQLVITAKKVKNQKMIHSPRPKVLIDGEIELSILYSASEKEEPIHTSKFAKRFQTFVERYPEYYDRKVKAVHILIEDGSIELVHCRKWVVRLLLFIFFT